MKRKLLALTLSTIMLSSVSFTAYANTNELAKTDSLVEYEKLIKESENALLEKGIDVSDENLQKVYINDDGQVCYDFMSVKKSSASSSSRGMIGDEYIPIADNINLFSTRASSTGYSQEWSNSTDLGDNFTEGYGVVKAYSNDSDSDLWYLEMKSNARIKAPGSGIGLRSFEWEITKDNKKVTLTDWTPSGTTVAKSGGFPISVSLELPKFKGITPTVGTDFALFQKKDTLQAGASSSKYSVKYYNNPDSGIVHEAYLLYYPNYQNLNAVVEYDLNGRDTEWSWEWKMGYNFLY